MSDNSDKNINKILLYFVIAISIIFFMAIFTNANAAAAIYGPTSCTSTHYRIVKADGTETFGVTSTSYNINWDAIGFSGTENMDSNSYYDMKITFINNINMSYFGDSVDLYSTTSLCGSTINQTLNVSSLSVSGKVLTIRLLTSNMVDYWTFFSQFNYNGSQGISSVTLTKVDLSGSSGIITNNNENTNNIINNNNQNTQDIINNQNDNTQDILDSQQNINDSLNTNCKNGPLTITTDGFAKIKNKFLSSDGTETSNNSYSISPYIIIKPNTSYTINFSTTSANVYWCWYNSNHVVLNCQNYSSSTVTWTSPSNAVALRFSLGGGRIIDISGPVCNDWNHEAINDINDILNNSDVSSGLIDNILDSDFFHNDDLLSIIVAPLTLATALTSDNSCQPLEMPFNFFNREKNAYLPCGSILWNHASTSLVNLYRLVVGGFIFYHVCVSLYFTIDNVLDPFKDKLEVVDL